MAIAQTPQHFTSFAPQSFFDNFLVKSKCKTEIFSQVFRPKNSLEINGEFLDKKLTLRKKPLFPMNIIHNDDK